MNIKKLIGFGLLATFIGCQGAPQIFDSAPPQPSSVYVFAPPQGRGPSAQNQGQGQGQAQGQGQVQGQVQGPRQGQGQAPPSHNHNAPPQNSGVVFSTSGHIHTDNNKAGGHPNGDLSKRRWTSPTGEPHESEESVDKQGNYHQIHRWTNKEGCSHETDHWTDDKSGDSHQCHRWIDKEGTTHEAVHVTKKNGKVISEHFSKDKNGKVKKHEDDNCKKKQHQKKKKDEDSESESKSSESESQSQDGKKPPRGKSGAKGPKGNIVHSANCVASRPNLSTHS